MTNKVFPWFKIALLNLVLVALVGLIMRAKFGFGLSYFNLKFLQHSHSHFAFAGWVSHILMVFMVLFLNQNKTSEINYWKRYNFILVTNLISAYGMLIAFAIQGYKAVSISFSSLSLLTSFIFAFYYWKDISRVSPKSIVSKWFKASLFFLVISAFGTLYLAYMMTTKNIVQDAYFASIYYYLHFQYNGWFLFACLGIFFDYFKINNSQINNHFLFWVTISCIPTYGLSVLWLEMPTWLYSTITIFAIIQTIAWFWFIFSLKKTQILIATESKFLNFLLVFSGVAIGLKFIAQLGSTIPALEMLAFSSRPMVIAYLHLVLLGAISLFLLYRILASQLVLLRKSVLIGLFLFFIGFLLNEIVLTIQGSIAITGFWIPYSNELLFIAAVLLFIGILISFITLKPKTTP